MPESGCDSRTGRCSFFGNPCRFRLDGDLALITGGGTGIGLAIAHCMADAGARVVLSGRREDKLREAAEEIGPQAAFVGHDVSKLSEAPALVESAAGRFGPFTILVNNAGFPTGWSGTWCSIRRRRRGRFRLQLPSSFGIG